MRSHARTPWPTLFFALLGLLWCGYIAFPTANPTPCATSGCALFRDTRVAGLSLWWVGGAYFFFLTVLCLRGNRVLARNLAMLALFGDSILLVIMFLTAPCFDCLVVAALMGCCYFSLRQQPVSSGWFTEEATRSLLLPIWFGLFFGNMVLAVNEQIPLYALGNTRTSEVRVYFSPSCPACREALLSLGNAAALYPVEEREGDVDAVIRLAALLKANVPILDALPRSLNGDEPVPYIPFYKRALLSIQLMRNKASLLRQGFRAVPLILINGMPGYKNTSLDGPAAQQQNPAQEAAAAGPVNSSDPIYTIEPSAEPSAPLPKREETGAVSSPQGAHSSGAEAPNVFSDERGLPDFLQNSGNLRKCGGADAPPCD